MRGYLTLPDILEEENYTCCPPTLFLLIGVRNIRLPIIFTEWFSPVHVMTPERKSPRIVDKNHFQRKCPIFHSQVTPAYVQAGNAIKLCRIGSRVAPYPIKSPLSRLRGRGPLCVMSFVWLLISEPQHDRSMSSHLNVALL